MFEINFHFVETKGNLKGLELDGSYKVPQERTALRDAKKFSKRKNTTGVSVIDVTTGDTVAYWNRDAGWAA